MNEHEKLVSSSTTTAKYDQGGQQAYEEDSPQDRQSEMNLAIEVVQ